MVRVIESPSIIEAVGNKPKRIEEYVGRASSGVSGVSIARMVSPSGWIEPGQTPEFDEYTLVLKGVLHVETSDGSTEVRAGQDSSGLQQLADVIAALEKESARCSGTHGHGPSCPGLQGSYVCNT